MSAYLPLNTDEAKALVAYHSDDIVQVNSMKGDSK